MLQSFASVTRHNIEVRGLTVHALGNNRIAHVLLASGAFENALRYITCESSCVPSSIGHAHHAFINLFLKLSFTGARAGTTVLSLNLELRDLSLGIPLCLQRSFFRSLQILAVLRKAIKGIFECRHSLEDGVQTRGCQR